MRRVHFLLEFKALFFVFDFLSTTTDDWPESTASAASAELPGVYLIAIFIKCHVVYKYVIC